MKWTALFSQTGSEIYQISEKLGRYPDIILCNKKDNFESINSGLLKSGKSIIIFTSAKPSIDEYLMYIQEDDLVTMHGWLRIVPGEVCEKREIYNGHPGDIVTYPCLKGKDPQLKAIMYRHKQAGCVLHRATADLDDGPIISTSDKIVIENMAEDEVFAELHKASVNMWVQFLDKKINECN